MIGFWFNRALSPVYRALSPANVVRCFVVIGAGGNIWLRALEGSVTITVVILSIVLGAAVLVLFNLLVASLSPFPARIEPGRMHVSLRLTPDTYRWVRHRVINRGYLYFVQSYVGVQLTEEHLRVQVQVAGREREVLVIPGEEIARVELSAHSMRPILTVHLRGDSPQFEGRVVGRVGWPGTPSRGELSDVVASMFLGGPRNDSANSIPSR